MNKKQFKKIRDLLYSNIIKFEIQKKDGTKRNLIGTLQKDILDEVIIKDKEKEKKEPRKDPDHIITLYDLEKKDWRRITITSILKWEILKK